jgi:Flp pilus assembly protein TadB
MTSAILFALAGGLAVSGIAAVCWPAWRRAGDRRKRDRQRLAGLVEHGAVEPSSGPRRGRFPQRRGRPWPTGGWHRDRDLRRPAAVLAGAAAGLLVGGWAGIGCGIAVAVVADRALRRLTPPAVRAERARCAADLPLAADLVAAALRSGVPVDGAVAAVAGVLGGPLGERLGRVARSLRLGGEPAEAWQHLTDVPGSARLAAAAVRSSSSGGALAGALTRLADDLRADRAVAAEAGARRAGVLVVLPLGLCFLPAFVLAGLVPVIVAVLGGVL